MRIETRGGKIIDLPDTPPRARAATVKIRDGLSSTARLTKRNKELLEAGCHPATHCAVLIGPGLTCGNCSHHHAYDWHTKTFHKCDLHRLGESHCESSDIRVSWPACSAFERAS